MSWSAVDDVVAGDDSDPAALDIPLGPEPDPEPDPDVAGHLAAPQELRKLVGEVA